MTTLDEYELLTSDEVRRAVAENRGRDPLDVALDARVPHARLVATQVKYLARAASKLPSYATAGCILPPRAFEQASSAAAAAHKTIGGGRLLDLTCGLGVDAFFLSRRFESVVALERDPVLARVATENFRRLGAANIEVVNTSAEEYLGRQAATTAEDRPDPPFDWIYADPDRRSAQGRKLVRLEDCSPDIIALMPLLKRASGRLCIKNSPLFDVGEALRLFPRARIEVISLADECKEVVIYDDGTGPSITATALGRGSFTAAGNPSGTADDSAGGRAIPDGDEASCPPAFDPARYKWLVVPDVALQKSRLARLCLRGKADIWSDNGFGFAPAAENPAAPVETPAAEHSAATENPAAPGILGRVLEIERIEPYEPKRLRRELRGCTAEILKRDFPIATEQIMRTLGLRAGGGHLLAFTKIDGRLWVVRLKKPQD